MLMPILTGKYLEDVDLLGDNHSTNSCAWIKFYVQVFGGVQKLRIHCTKSFYNQDVHVIFFKCNRHRALKCRSVLEVLVGVCVYTHVPKLTHECTCIQNKGTITSDQSKWRESNKSISQKVKLFYSFTLHQEVAANEIQSFWRYQFYSCKSLWSWRLFNSNIFLKVLEDTLKQLLNKIFHLCLI